LLAKPLQLEPVCCPLSLREGKRTRSFDGLTHGYRPSMYDTELAKLAGSFGARTEPTTRPPVLVLNLVSGVAKACSNPPTVPPTSWAR